MWGLEIDKRSKDTPHKNCAQGFCHRRSDAFLQTGQKACATSVPTMKKVSHHVPLFPFILPTLQVQTHVTGGGVDATMSGSTSE